MMPASVVLKPLILHIGGLHLQAEGGVLKLSGLDEAASAV